MGDFHPFIRSARSLLFLPAKRRTLLPPSSIDLLSPPRKSELAKEREGTVLILFFLFSSSPPPHPQLLLLFFTRLLPLLPLCYTRRRRRRRRHRRETESTTSERIICLPFSVSGQAPVANLLLLLVEEGGSKKRAKEEECQLFSFFLGGGDKVFTLFSSSYLIPRETPAQASTFFLFLFLSSSSSPFLRPRATGKEGAVFWVMETKFDLFFALSYTGSTAKKSLSLFSPTYNLRKKLNCLGISSSLDLSFFLGNGMEITSKRDPRTQYLGHCAAAAGEKKFCWMFWIAAKIVRNMDTKVGTSAEGAVQESISWLF